MPIFRRRWSTPVVQAPAAAPAQASLALAVSPVVEVPAPVAAEAADAVSPVVQAHAPEAQASLALAVSPVVEVPASAAVEAQASLALAVSPVVQAPAPVPFYEIKVNTIQAFFNSARAAMVAPAIPELVITEITPASVSVTDTHESVAPAPATKKASLYSFLNRRHA